MSTSERYLGRRARGRGAARRGERVTTAPPSFFNNPPKRSIESWHQNDKFKAPLNPFDVEAQLSSIKAPRDFAEKRFYQKLLRSKNGEDYQLLGDAVALGRRRRKYYENMADFEFAEDFRHWLTKTDSNYKDGNGNIRTEGSTDPTRPYQPLFDGGASRPLMHLPGVSEYIDEHVSARARFKKVYVPLAVYGPRNLPEAFLFYKYIVQNRMDPQNPDRINEFLRDYDFYASHEDAKVQGAARALTVVPDDTTKGPFPYNRNYPSGAAGPPTTVPPSTPSTTPTTVPPAGPPSSTSGPSWSVTGRGAPSYLWGGDDSDGDVPMEDYDEEEVRRKEAELRRRNLPPIPPRHTYLPPPSPGMRYDPTTGRFTRIHQTEFEEEEEGEEFGSTLGEFVPSRAAPAPGAKLQVDPETGEYSYEYVPETEELESRLKSLAPPRISAKDPSPLEKGKEPRVRFEDELMLPAAPMDDPVPTEMEQRLQKLRESREELDIREAEELAERLRLKKPSKESKEMASLESRLLMLKRPIEERVYSKLHGLVDEVSVSSPRLAVFLESQLEQGTYSRDVPEWMVKHYIPREFDERLDPEELYKIARTLRELIFEKEQGYDTHWLVQLYHKFDDDFKQAGIVENLDREWNATVRERHSRQREERQKLLEERKKKMEEDKRMAEEEELSRQEELQREEEEKHKKLAEGFEEFKSEEEKLRRAELKKVLKEKEEIEKREYEERERKKREEEEVDVVTEEEGEEVEAPVVPDDEEFEKQWNEEVRRKKEEEEARMQDEGMEWDDLMGVDVEPEDEIFEKELREELEKTEEEERERGRLAAKEEQKRLDEEEEGRVIEEELEKREREEEEEEAIGSPAKKRRSPPVERRKKPSLSEQLIMEQRAREITEETKIAELLQKNMREAEWLRKRQIIADKKAREALSSRRALAEKKRLQASQMSLEAGRNILATLPRVKAVKASPREFSVRPEVNLPIISGERWEHDTMRKFIQTVQQQDKMIDANIRTIYERGKKLDNLERAMMAATGDKHMELKDKYRELEQRIPKVQSYLKDKRDLYALLRTYSKNIPAIKEQYLDLDTLTRSAMARRNEMVKKFKKASEEEKRDMLTNLQLVVREYGPMKANLKTEIDRLNSQTRDIALRNTGPNIKNVMDAVFDYGSLTDEADKTENELKKTIRAFKKALKGAR